MRITQWGEYGVLCMVLLSKAEGGAPPIQASEIASSLSIALDYTQQILQRLRRGALIKTTRGPAGGYSLARAAQEITLRDILAASEGATFEVICERRPLAGNCALADKNCFLKAIWQNLRTHIDNYLSQLTLADLSNASKASSTGLDPLVAITSRTSATC